MHTVMSVHVVLQARRKYSATLLYEGNLLRIRALLDNLNVAFVHAESELRSKSMLWSRVRRVESPESASLESRICESPLVCPMVDRIVTTSVMGIG